MDFFRPTYVEPAPSIEKGDVMALWSDYCGTLLPVGVHHSKLINGDEEIPVMVTVREDGTAEIRLVYKSV